MDNTSEQSSIYFASLPTDEIGAQIVQRIRQFYRFVDSSGRRTLWGRIYQQYYSGYYFKGEIKRMGSQGQLRKMSVNHFKNILQYTQVLASNQRPAFEPRSVNSDYKSYAQVILARNLLDYYMSSKKLEDYINQILEYGVVYGEGWLFADWDTGLGDVIGTKEDGSNIRNGDIVFSTYTPLDIPRDVTKCRVEDHEWYCIRKFINKFELAAKYPEWKEEIVSFSPSIEDSRFFDVDDINVGSVNEEIPYFVFLHKKTASVPEGRMVELLQDDVVLFDGPLPYKEYPLIPLIPESMNNTPFGYSISYDMLPIQLSLDALYSSVLTNQLALAVQNIMCPKGTGVVANDIVGGLNFIEYNSTAGKPEPLNLLATPQEVFGFMGNLIQQMETISGVNSVARGNPEASLKSGAALALVHSTALQFNRGIQRGYISAIERIGTHVIDMLKQYASTPRVALITGQSNRSYLKEFTGDAISDIDRVIVDVGNPLMRTIAGKETIATTLLERGMIKTPEQYLQLLNTGSLQPLTEGITAEMMLIKRENEDMSEGKDVIAVITDNHLLHINEHKPVMASPESRSQAEVVSAVSKHLQLHITLLQTGDKDLLMLLGQQPLQQEALGAPPPVHPGQASEALQQGAAPGQEPGQLPQLPNMPKNPMTGKQYNSEVGV